jgi:Zn-dependent protease with chaperone function
MSAALVFVGLLLLTLPGLRILPLGELNPAEWTRAVKVALHAGVLTTRLGLLFGAAPTVLRAIGVDHAANACHRMFGPVAPGGPVVGWAAAIACAWFTIRVHQGRCDQRRALERTQVEPWVGTHDERDGIDVVTLPVSELLAYAVPLAGGQVVISEGLLADLEPAEVEVVLAHEASHLTNHHERHLSVAASVDRSFGWFAPARASTQRLRLGIERWADEDAATTPARRAQVRAALAKTTASLLGPALAFSSTCTVLHRLDALDDGPPDPTSRTRVAALAPLLTTGLFAAVLLGMWSTYSHHGLMGLLGICLG